MLTQAARLEQRLAGGAILVEEEGVDDAGFDAEGLLNGPQGDEGRVGLEDRQEERQLIDWPAFGAEGAHGVHGWEDRRGRHRDECGRNTPRLQEATEASPPRAVSASGGEWLIPAESSRGGTRVAGCQAFRFTLAGASTRRESR